MRDSRYHCVSCCVGSVWLGAARRVDLVCVVSVPIGASIRSGLRTLTSAATGSDTGSDGTIRSHTDLLLICWLSLLLGLLSERMAAAGRAAEYGRAELAALMGSVQLELREKTAAINTFRAAGNACPSVRHVGPTSASLDYGRRMGAKEGSAS